jgi:hypothetical protein
MQEELQRCVDNSPHVLYQLGSEDRFTRVCGSGSGSLGVEMTRRDGPACPRSNQVSVRSFVAFLAEQGKGPKAKDQDKDKDKAVASSAPAKKLASAPAPHRKKAPPAAATAARLAKPSERAQPRVGLAGPGRASLTRHAVPCISRDPPGPAVERHPARGVRGGRR